MNPLRLFPWFSIFFAIIVAAELVGLSGYPQVRLASKCMIMAALIGLYILAAKRQSQVLLLGMIFALLGDAFLLFQGDTFFLLGLCCFLVMQICYTAHFWAKRRIPKTRDKAVSFSLFLLPIVVVGIGWEQFGDLLVPVAIYALAITAMLVSAYMRHPKLRGYGQVLLGSILFVVSDLSLAVSKFVLEFSGQQYLVMVSYILAQYLIITGIIMSDHRRHSEEPKVIGTFGRHKAVSHKK